MAEKFQRKRHNIPFKVFFLKTIRRESAERESAGFNEDDDDRRDSKGGKHDGEETGAEAEDGSDKDI